MYEKYLIRSHIHSVEGGFLVTMTYGGARVWESEYLRLTHDDAAGFVKDIDRTLKYAICAWCDQPADRVSDFGNLDTDTGDISLWCRDDRCYSLAMRELETA